MAVEARIELEPDKRHHINFTALTALFAEVLERLALESDLDAAGGAGGFDHQIASYRRRWKEITGIEVPE